MHFSSENKRGRACHQFSFLNVTQNRARKSQIIFVDDNNIHNYDPDGDNDNYSNDNKSNDSVVVII